jgi:hypothetical protein
MQHIQKRQQKVSIINALKKKLKWQFGFFFFFFSQSSFVLMTIVSLGTFVAMTVRNALMTSSLILAVLRMAKMLINAAHGA